MNLLFIIGSLKHGGAERQTVIDANYFSGKYNVMVMTFCGGELEGLLNKNIKYVVLEKKGYLNASKRLREILINEKINIVNASLFASMIISVIASGKLNIPVIWFFHSHEYDIELKSKLAFKYFSRKNCLKKIFFVSRELQRHFSFRRFGFPAHKEEILYNIYTVNNSNAIKNKNGKITIGYIGRLVALKRIEYLPELAEYLIKEGITDFRICILGDGPERVRLEKLAEEKNVSGYIKFEGFQKDVEKYYNTFDVFALPSQEECLSISLIDACVKELPSVAFDTGGNNEIIVNGKNGYIVNEKMEFFERVKELVLDAKKRGEFGRAAREYCLNKFSAAARFEKLENIYNKLISEN
ncbi:MAG: glycosyltransferase [Ignavibacteriae bacterium]|nr:glycosyltransferase [Ignavibacteriota bacterium]